MVKEMTCIVCPMGCQLEVTVTDGEVTYIKGNSCPRGIKYAKDELTNPQRMVTTTIMCDNGELLPVKTDKPVNKNDVFKVMETVNKSVAHLPIRINDVIIKDVCGANIVAVKNID